MKQKIYRLLMVEHREMLDACYRQVFTTDSPTPPIKTFEDCLTDFYLYLLEAKPKRVPGKTEGYYLTQVKDEKALPGWLRQTFRHFLLEEHKILAEMQEALKEYRQQLATQKTSQPIDLSLMHVAFSLAWFNQHESEQDRYLFFRSAFKHFSGFYSWPDDELDDNEIAAILEISPGTLRTRTSRLCAKVRRLVYELNDALIASLDRTALDIAQSIYADPEPDIKAILEDLLGKAERDLPQYETILLTRQSKRENRFRFLAERSTPICEEAICPSSERHEMPIPIPNCAPSVREKESSIPVLEENTFAMPESIEEDFSAFLGVEEEQFKPSRESISDRIVKLFKSFIGA